MAAAAPRVLRALLVAAAAAAGLVAEAPAARAPTATLLAAGDIADCGGSWLDRLGESLGLADGARTEPPAAATARLVARLPGTVLALGDLAYHDGSAEQIRECYEPTWGRFKARTRPVPGNHDYRTGDGAPYYGYWGEAAGPDRRGYYSFELGGWYVLALNSEIATGPDSPQGRWLRRRLALADERCVLAYAHRPAFSSGKHGGDPEMRRLFRILYDHGASVLLAGHDHHYERTAPLDPQGRPEPGRGLRQFVAGTGGARLRPLPATRAPWSRAATARHWGVLRLDLYPERYTWRFLPAGGGEAIDAGEARCVDRAALSRSSG